MSEANLIDELHKFLISEKRLAYFNSSRSELTVRCPFCGDSTKNLNHGHMYIAAIAPFSFFCQRCETKGYLNMETLRDFQIESPELTVEITKAARKAIKNTTKSGGNLNSLLTGKRRLVLPAYNEDSRIHARKVEYLEDRWGCSLSTKELARLKVITNYNDFIDINNLKNLERFYAQNDYYSQLRAFLTKRSVGFLSTDTNYATFRHTKIPNNGRRYYTESHNRPVDIGNKLYTISNRIDVLSSEVNLILAEGPLDIGAIWLNMYDRHTTPDTIFGAVNGRAYNLFITTLRRMGFFKINLDLYSDAEIPLARYKYVLNKEHFGRINIHYNEYSGEKDFGVPLNKIKCKTFKLK